MALLELIGRLGLNTQPFEAGLKRAESKAHSAGDQIGHAFKHVGLGLLGIHALGRTLRHIISETINWSKDIEKAREEFKRLGVEIDEGALNSIRESGIELERLKATLVMTIAPLLGGLGKAISMAGSTTARAWNFLTGQSNAGLDKEILKREMANIGATTKEEQDKFLEERNKKLEPLREQLQKITEKNLMDQMDDQQKLAHLLQKHLEVLDLLKTAGGGGGRLKTEIEEQTLLGQIVALRNKKGPPEIALPKLDFGSLARVGGFGMTPGFVAPNRMNQLYTYAQYIAKNTQITADELRAFRQEQQFVNLRAEFEGGFKQL